MKLILSVFLLINLQILIGLSRTLPEAGVGIERPETNIQAIKIESVMRHWHLDFLCSQTISEKCICYMSWNLNAELIPVSLRKTISLQYSYFMLN